MKSADIEIKATQEPDSVLSTQYSVLVSEVWDALAEVPDPEIPMISVVDLGIIRTVERDEAHVRVEVMPTFVACPALDIIRETIRTRLAGFAPTIEVVTTYAEPWTTERITPEGRRKLRASGFAPPVPGEDVCIAPGSAVPILRLPAHRSGKPLWPDALPRDLLLP